MSMITRFCSSSHRQEDTTDRLSIVDTPVNRQVGHHGSFFALCGIGIGTLKRWHSLSQLSLSSSLDWGRVYAELVCRLFFQEDRRWDKIFHKKMWVTTSLLIPPLERSNVLASLRVCLSNEPRHPNAASNDRLHARNNRSKVHHPPDGHVDSSYSS